MKKSSPPTDNRLHALLGGDTLAGLRRRLRRYFERLDPAASPAPLRLSSLLPEEREALAVLVGRPPSHSQSIRIDVAALDVTLRDAGLAGSLREALELIDGPITNRAAALAQAQSAWSSVVASCSHPALMMYLRSPASLGILKRLARNDAADALQLLKRAELVLRRLPAGGLPRAQLAAETLGNSHALDNGQATATLVLGAWRQPHAESTDLEEAGDESLRTLWARAGVAVNELAKPALTLNLPGKNDSRYRGTSGEPAYFSLRQLLRAPPEWEVAEVQVFVCENPNLVAIAADALGTLCRPLICTDGAPAAAQRTLLTQLRKAGARLAYHGDFDWPGVRLANHVMRVHEASPWRMGKGDYEAAVSSAPNRDSDLAGPPVDATWDAALAPAMLERGTSVPEEAVAESLLLDLRK